MEQEYIRPENQDELNIISKFITTLVSENFSNTVKFKPIEKFNHYQLRNRAKKVLKNRDFGYKEELIALSNLDTCFSQFVETTR